MTLIQQLRAQWQQSRDQLASNPRLGWGVWCVLLILLLYINLVLKDSRIELGQDLQILQQRAVELGDLSQQNDWPERLEAATAALAEQSTFFGEAENEALARADVQAKVNSLLVASGLERSRIEVSAAPTAAANSDLIALQLRISGEARGEQLLTLLGGLEHAKPSYLISSLTASQSINSEHVNYQLLATVWFKPFEADQ